MRHKLTPKAAIFGLAGTVLTPEEQFFFQQQNPVGFILFARNIATPEQVRKLVADLRACVTTPNAPVLIDQEGGRVARLKPPYFRKTPAAGIFAEIAKRDLAKAKEAVFLNNSLIATELYGLGINVNCTPILDIPAKGAHDIIGDRAYGTDVEIVTTLAQAVCDAHLQRGIIPIIKHIPGHGRAEADSHEELPVVKASRKELDAIDFKPFKNLAAMPWAMTAHIVYTAIDPKAPATLSPEVIQVIRKDLGFKGLLISDDLSMKALSASFGERTVRSLAAGCDVVLHCNGDMQEMEEIAAHAGPLTDKAQTRLAKSFEMLKGSNVDVHSAQERLTEILEAFA